MVNTFSAKELQQGLQIGILKKMGVPLEVENDDADATGDNDTDDMYQDGNETEGVDKNVSKFEG